MKRGEPSDYLGGRVKLGVIEFSSKSMNPGLNERFYDVVDDLRESASIVDVWLMDIATVLKEFGYEMRIDRTLEKENSLTAIKANRP